MAQMPLHLLRLGTAFQREGGARMAKGMGGQFDAGALTVKLADLAHRRVPQLAAVVVVVDADEHVIAFDAGVSGRLAPGFNRFYDDRRELNMLDDAALGRRQLRDGMTRFDDQIGPADRSRLSPSQAAVEQRQQ